MRIPTGVKDNVRFLYQPTARDMLPAGTGFFVSTQEGGLVHTYLVSARHVVEDRETGELIPLEIRWTEGGRKGPTKFGPIYGDWYFHEDPAVDLAVVPWEPPADAGQGWTGSVLLRPIVATEEVLKSEGLPLIEGDEVFFVGLFQRFQGIRSNLPFVRFGRMSLVTDEKVPSVVGPPGSRARFLFAECAAYPGFSGSPLYLWRPAHVKKVDGRLVPKEDEISLIGVVSGFYPDEETVLDEYGVDRFTHFGLSLAVPIQKLMEIIDSPAFKKVRGDRIAAEQSQQRATPALNREARRSRKSSTHGR